MTLVIYVSKGVPLPLTPGHYDKLLNITNDAYGMFRKGIGRIHGILRVARKVCGF